MSHDNNPTNKQSRRTTLKTLLAGGGVLSLAALPSRWAKPVVDSVMLPAHAQTSPSGANGFAVEVDITDASDWLDWLLPKAHAGVRPILPSGFLCVQETGDKSFEASYDTGEVITYGAGNYGECVTLACGPFEIDIVVGGRNGDGSFDFELYRPGEGCSEKSRIATERTNRPCNIASKQCKKEEVIKEEQTE
jgi:hypothetical protein